MKKIYFSFFLFFTFSIFFISANFSFAADNNELLGTNCKDEGTATSGPEDLKIKYMGNSSLGYGNSASSNAQPFSMIVMHDPGSSDCNLNSAVNYGLTVDASRGGQFGYHFYVGQDGAIAQGAPMNKRTNHVSMATSIVNFQFSNTFALGITLVCGSVSISQKQLETSVKLAQAIQVAYNISSGRIYGHSELQSN